ncbi:unnamed protein product [Anisakis simplex]|uniref:Ovule protein n=1 Tax=Anisakis simplex TaxID=6269 RepID=A0A0M3JFA8_ANISI|nr:unnamed protein product [Anisakis simplex]
MESKPRTNMSKISENGATASQYAVLTMSLISHVEVEVPLEESAAKDSMNEPSQKQALHEAEITELHNYANELDEEMKRWKELLDEEEHCVSEAKRLILFLILWC